MIHLTALKNHIDPSGGQNKNRAKTSLAEASFYRCFIFAVVLVSCAFKTTAEVHPKNYFLASLLRYVGFICPGLENYTSTPTM